MIVFAAFLLHVVASFAAVLPNGSDDVVLTYLTGIVRDSDRKPIAGVAVSLLGTYGYCQTRANSPGTGRGTSDASGRYRLALYTKQGGTVEVHRLSAEGKGVLRVYVNFPVARPVMKAGETTEMNLELARGEVLSGVVRVPPRLRDRLYGRKPNEQWFIIRVYNKSFSQMYRTEPGGAFEVWVPKGVFDVELTLDGETSAATLTNVASGTRGLELVKRDTPVAPGVLAPAFDALWEDMARNYSYFDLKQIDWPGLKEKYRARASAADTLPAFVDVLGEMLGELNDGHVRFLAPADAVVLRPPMKRKVDGNFEAAEATIKGADWIGNGFARIGTLQGDDFGVVRITRQSRADAAAVQKVVEFIRTHNDLPGFLIDLRGADGGDEHLAARIAAEFCLSKTVYAKSKYRNGPKPTDFGPVYDRVLEPATKPYTKPVVCILGPGCVSSGEALAQMLTCLPHVTSVGLPTRGSSGNPRPFKLPGVAVTVLYSRWVDLMPDGSPIEGKGIQPRILVDLPASAYEKSDPTREKAIDILRTNVKAAK
ncbi:MAG TPA: S41 family peptidase [Gemmataceae bacterium]|nr:S41 family peptidase [Gemmataceae bacterium]